MAETSQPKTLFVVDRHRPGVLRYLQERFKNNPGVEIVLDRRMRDRRSGAQALESERRRSDRRTEPPDLSATRGFIVVPAKERRRSP